MINKKNILTPSSYSEFNLFNSLLIDKLNRYSINPHTYDLKFVDCSFGIYDTFLLQEDKSNKINKSIHFDSCRLTNLVVKNLTGDIRLSNSNINLLRIKSSKNIQVEFLKNTLLKNVHISNCSNLELNFQNNYQLVSSSHNMSNVIVSNSSISHLVFYPNFSSNSYYTFSEDTINNGFASYRNNPLGATGGKENLKDTGYQMFNFQNCYINASFHNFGEFFNASFHFYDCSFGPEADLSNLGIRSLSFNNCKNIPPRLHLSFTNDTSEILLTLINTDVSNIWFDFPDNVKLAYKYVTKKDLVFNAYENLLSKYRIEGKHDSYRNVDIQYKEYKNWKIINFFDKYWWYYGYRKYYVLLYTVGFLIIFSFFNLRNWDKIRLVYPIIEAEENSYYDNLHHKWKNKIRRLLNVIIFTSIIFFSIHMNFEKISFKRTFLLSWIFFQYITGLICLFFILRFILDIQ